MKNFLFSLIIMFIASGCVDNEEQQAAQQSYESKKEQLKTSIRSYNEVSKKIGITTPSLLDRGESGYMHRVNSELVTQFPEENIFLIADKVESEMYSSQLPERILDRQDQMIQVVEQRSEIFYTQLQAANLKILAEGDSISVDSINAYFGDFKTSILEDLKQEEESIDEDESLSEDERLALIAANYHAQASLTHFVDGLVDELIYGDGVENGKVSGFFKKLLNSFKRVVNFVTTTLVSAVKGAVVGAFVGMATFGVPGLFLGAGSGFILGAFNGALTYDTNPICVFAQSNPDKPCYFGS